MNYFSAAWAAWCCFLLYYGNITNPAVFAIIGIFGLAFSMLALDDDASSNSMEIHIMNNRRY
jgi:hypothetical protein